jgi:beta-glucosidase
MTKLKTLIAQMTLEEKAALCTGASLASTISVERVGIPECFINDGPHGVRRAVDLQTFTQNTHPATCFPTASALASTWDVDLMHAMGQALGEECIALNVDVLLGPGINMKRTPLGGRNFEYFSEDPFLAGEMAASLINGIQSQGVGTSLKHFAVNNQEFERFCINAEVDERTLREIYLTAFEIAVHKAQPWTVMCAYNKVNGTFCSEHHQLLTDILKEEWGFEGFVVSDWGAVHDRVAALKAGLDLEMPGPRPRRVQAVVDAVRNGTLTEAVLDESVRRILHIVFKAKQTRKGGSFDVTAHNALARKISSESMVLLKNNGLLPLKQPERMSHIAVIGRAAEHAHFQGGGSSHVNPTQVSVPFKALQQQLPHAELVYAEGYPSGDSFQQALIDEAVQVAQKANVALLYIALPSFKESEGYDRADLDLTRQQVALIKAVTSVQKNTVVILNNGAPVVMSEWIDDTAAVLEAWMMGQSGGDAIADVLLGKTNPCGKLAETFPLRLSDTPAYLNHPGENGIVRYGEGLFIGYRYYDAKHLPVQFPFGFGLSYTTFAYSNLKLSATHFNDVDGLAVSVDVTNTGAVAGKEIVQVYVHECKSRLIRPDKELKGFAKVELQPGETKTVTVQLGFRAFAYFHPGHHRWVAESGEFDILVGASSADIRCNATVTLRSTLELPSLLHPQSTVRAWLDDAHGKLVFEPMFSQIMTQWGALLSSGDSNGKQSESAVGMDLIGFMMDMPLLNLLEFQENALPKSADEIVGGMLHQVHLAQLSDQ